MSEQNNEPQLGIEKDVSEFLSGAAPMTEALDAFLVRFERVQWFFIYGQMEQTALMLRTIAAQNEILISQKQNFGPSNIGGGGIVRI